ncbi:hypothetical protein ETAA8_41760 [Anatilimnocola aggregata]|uniref:Uncharacterized protein n=1 Tax=Anatilimnocola aggregata TaxID=2528021 RepID=A0A517YFS1_9BACT|nr:hypothetical protein [Anatilimnocola aggregata]QDU29069.1 hypothetical protein ETAA8_41760 [Anatilimnocola aggregata]
MFATASWSLRVGLALLAVAGLQLLGIAEEPKKGLGVGELIPISSMRCVVGQPTDRNTCLAGKYRGNQTISIYVRTLDEPNLNTFLTKVNGQLANQEELRGYVLLLGGGQFDEKLKSKIRDWAKEQAFTKLDVAIANGEAIFGIAKEAGVVVVYSEKRQVKYHRTLEAGQLDESAVKELAEKLAEVTALKP